MAPFDQERNACEMVRMRELDCKGRPRCEGSELRRGRGAREDADLVDVPCEIRCDVTNLDSRRGAYRQDWTCRVGCLERPVHVELHQTVSKHSGRMMPCAVVVGERAYDFREHVRTDRLVERRAEPSVRHHAQLPRTAASLDSAVVGRGIRRPPEPGGDREVRGGYGNRGSRDSISCVEVPRLTDFPGDIRRAGNRAVIYVPREVFHPSVEKKGLHVVLKDGTGGRRWRC